MSGVDDGAPNTPSLDVNISPLSAVDTEPKDKGVGALNGVDVAQTEGSPRKSVEGRVAALSADFDSEAAMTPPPPPPVDTGKVSGNLEEDEGGDGDKESDSGSEESEESEEDDSDEEDVASAVTVDMSSIKYFSVQDDVTYTLPLACSMGNLPVTVLLWGMCTAKGWSPFTPDSEGNNPLHYAVLADTTETLDFILDQEKTLPSPFRPPAPLINSRNDDEETPLLRASSKGRINVIKALIRNGADLGVTDTNKNTIIANSARNGHFSQLHFLLSLMPSHIAQNLLHQCDIDEHTPLDWACYKGHTNVAEYLIFRGIEPTHLDRNGRNCLHWAAKEGQAETAAYLVALGMDPWFKDNAGDSPAMFSLSNRTLFESMMLNPGKNCGYRGGATMGADAHFTPGCCGSVVMTPVPDIENPEAKIPGSTRGLLSMKVQKCLSGIDIDSATPGLNPALMRKNPTRNSFLFFFTFLTFSIWGAFIFLPFWASILTLLVVLFGYRNIAGNIKAYEKFLTKREGRDIKLDGFLPQIMNAHETAIGFWFGCALSFLAAVTCSFVVHITENVSPDTEPPSQYLASLYLLASFWSNTPIILYVLSFALAAMIVSWAVLVFVHRDPGTVFANRNATYNEILEEMAQTGEDPDTRKWCTTTLVKKPLRAKYDAPTGLLVARHDHYCIWLDTAVGFGNHRIFMVFVFFQVLSHVLFSVMGWLNLVNYMRQYTSTSDACDVISTLVSRNFFGVLCLTLCANICTCGLGFLLAQQTSNMMNNITTNERINAKRYPWLQDDSGTKFVNRFDSGSTWTNVVEFLTKSRDYTQTYDMPPVRAGVLLKNNCCGDKDCKNDTNLREPLVHDHDHDHVDGHQHT